VPRRIRFEEPGYLHVFNRAVRRATLFACPGDFAAFLEVLAEAQRRVPISLAAYCLMPNHFHLVVGPVQNVELSTFMHRLTLMHSKRWHRFHETDGTGPVYQGRYKARPIGSDVHFLTVCRYVELNPVRAGLVAKAEEWPWSSLVGSGKNCHLVQLSKWPILRPLTWE
jgi:putative transposase